MPSQQRLIVFTRFPQPGQMKTRLAPTPWDLRAPPTWPAGSPWRDDRLLERALAALANHDVVLGPARDGGYYLVGLSKSATDLFQEFAWGTDQMLNQTLAAAR